MMMNVSKRVRAVNTHYTPQLPSELWHKILQESIQGPRQARVKSTLERVCKQFKLLLQYQSLEFPSIPRVLCVGEVIFPWTKIENRFECGDVSATRFGNSLVIHASTPHATLVGTPQAEDVNLVQVFTRLQHAMERSRSIFIVGQSVGEARRPEGVGSIISDMAIFALMTSRVELNVLLVKDFTHRTQATPLTQSVECDVDHLICENCNLYEWVGLMNARVRKLTLIMKHGDYISIPRAFANRLSAIDILTGMVRCETTGEREKSCATISFEGGLSVWANRILIHVDGRVTKFRVESSEGSPAIFNRDNIIIQGISEMVWYPARKENGDRFMFEAEWYYNRVGALHEWKMIEDLKRTMYPKEVCGDHAGSNQITFSFPLLCFETEPNLLEDDLNKILLTVGDVESLKRSLIQMDLASHRERLFSLFHFLLRRLQPLNCDEETEGLLSVRMRMRSEPVTRLTREEVEISMRQLLSKPYLKTSHHSVCHSFPLACDMSTVVWRLGEVGGCTFTSNEGHVQCSEGYWEENKNLEEDTLLITQCTLMFQQPDGHVYNHISQHHGYYTNKEHDQTPNEYFNRLHHRMVLNPALKRRQIAKYLFRVQGEDSESLDALWNYYIKESEE